MREDHEELILRNPAFGACALWHMARSFADASEGAAPTLAHLVLGAGMLFHASTVEKIHSMWLESGLLKAIADQPELIAGLQRRMEASLPAALSALQVGVAAKVLEREGGPGLPSFRALGTNLPSALRGKETRANKTNAAARRLGAWFASENMATIQGRLGVKF